MSSSQSKLVITKSQTTSSASTSQLGIMVRYMQQRLLGLEKSLHQTLAFKRTTVLMGFVTSRNVTLVQLNFIDNVCHIFEDFLKSFQSDSQTEW